MDSKDCIFCRIARKEIKADIVYEDDSFIAFLDINPDVEGHTLVLPKKHFTTLLDMPNTLGNEMLEAIKKVSLKLIKDGKAEGFNVIFNNYKLAGQEVPHVHAHIIPRKKDDGMKLKMINGLRDRKK